MASNLRIAPTTIVQDDFKSFNPPLSGNVDTLLRDALRVLSVEGHSTQGHGQFKSQKFPDTTQLDIAEKALGEQRAKEVRKRVYDEIIATKDTMFELLDIAFGYKNPRNSPLYDHGENSLRLDNMDLHKPLWGFAQNQELTIPTSQFEILQALRGGYIGFSMDTDERRQDTVRTFKRTLDDSILKIGTGSCHVGYRKRMRKEGVSLERLANDEISQDEIDWLYKKHVLVNVNEFRENHNPELFPVFIRGEEGPGCCDDATTIAAGLLQYDLGFDFVKRAHLFARNSDYVDTFDKISASPITGGSDEHIGEQLNSRYMMLAHKQNALRASDFLKSNFKYNVNADELENELCYGISSGTLQNYMHKKTGSAIDLSPLEGELLDSQLASNRDITTSIYFGAKGNTPEIPFSNSVRRFEYLQTGAGNKGITHAGKAHEFFLETGSPASGLIFGFSKTDSKSFYETVLERLDTMVERGYFPKPQFK